MHACWAQVQAKVEVWSTYILCTSKLDRYVEAFVLKQGPQSVPQTRPPRERPQTWR